MNLKYIIVNADDAGLSPEVDAGILETIRSGIVGSVSLLVNPPFQADLEPFIESGISIGLHLNHTIGYPCSSLHSFKQGGIAYSTSFSGRKPGLTENAEEFCPDEVKHEFLSQLYRFRKLTGCDPTHLDVHKHLHYRSAEIFSIVLDMAKRLNVPMRCLNGDMRAICRDAGVRTTDYFTGGVFQSPYWTIEKLKEQLAGISDGITEIMCHPGAGMKPMPGIKYVAERDTERETFISAEAKEFFAMFRRVNFHNAPFD